MQIYEFHISKIIIHQIQFITLIEHLILVINLQGIVQWLKGRIDNQILGIEGLRNTHALVGQCYNEGDNRQRNCGELEVKITLTLVVLLSISLFSLTTQIITTGTSSDLSRKVWVTAYKGDTY